MKIKAPYFDNLLRRAQAQPIVVEECVKAELMQIIEIMKSIAVCGDDEQRMLWIYADRGDIDDFAKFYGSYEECVEDEDVSSREEYEELWDYYYPESAKWYALTVAHFRDDYYFYVGHELTFHITSETDKAYHVDNNELTALLKAEITERIESLKSDEDSYNNYVSKNLSYRKRTGKILRQTYWNIFPDSIQELLRGLTSGDIDILCKVVAQSANKVKLTPLSKMTAGIFFDCCKMGYEANNYLKGRTDLTPRDMYRAFSDGRDGGLKEIELNSEEAFMKWYRGGSYGTGHPWEVCRGGNSTHISLFLHEEPGGWSFWLAGSSRARVAETVRFAIALYNNNIPVKLRDAEEILAMVCGTDYIGIVPEGITPCYCGSFFPKDDRITDFMNLDTENQEEIIAQSYWYPVQRVELETNN